MPPAPPPDRDPADAPGDDPLAAFRRQRIGLGIVTPSGNVVVERVTVAILRDFPAASAHFTRVEVSGATGRDAAPGYDHDAMRRAAVLLAQAGVAALCWNGSRGASIGVDHDRVLCEALTAETGLPATTATLAVLDALRLRGARRFGLVTPYAAAFGDAMAPYFAAEGFSCVAATHAELTDNLSYAGVPDARIAAMVRAVARDGAQAVLAHCTNFPAAPLAAALERETGLPVVDGVSAATWAVLRLAGLPTAPGRRWGGPFGAGEAPSAAGG